MYLLHNFDERRKQEDGLKSLDNALMTQQYLRSNSNFCRRRITSVLRVEGPKAGKTNTKIF